MNLVLALSTSICLLLTSCNRGRISNKLLDSVDQNSLQQEAKGLFAKARQLDEDAARAQSRSPAQSNHRRYKLAADQFPPTIKKLDPPAVRYAQDGVWLIYHTAPGIEDGYFIPDKPTADSDPDDKIGYEIHEIKPGFFSWRTDP